MKLPPFFNAGHKSELGSHRFTEQEILRFARKYDPQRFHTDPQAARESVLGGLCASGWHTASVWMKYQRIHTERILPRLAEEGLAQVEYGPAFGITELKWPRPVFVDDTVTYFNETTDCRASETRPGWHVLAGRMSGVNQNGDLVLSFSSAVLVRYPA